MTPPVSSFVDVFFPPRDQKPKESEYAPLGIGLHERFEHTHILGGTGHGKTQLIQYLIKRDLEEDSCVIVIDNQRQMIPKLARLGVDMQYLSPQYPLSLNLFDMPSSHHTAPLLQYVLSSIMNAPLTPKQELIFQFGVTLMLAVRGNIETFQRLLDGEAFDLSGVDPTTRRFFETEFPQRQYQQTRQEISWRIWSLLKNPILRDMFAADKNRCRLELDRKLILIDTDIELLQDYSGMFGRFFIAQLLQAAHQRFAGAERPVYVYLDECYYYLDTNVTSMLETARKAKIGLILAHQYLGQITEPKVREALMSLTSTKFAGGLSPSDSYAMAQAMRTEHEYIDGQSKLNFALYQRGHGLHSIKVPVGVIEGMEQHEIPHEEMKARYGRSSKIVQPETAQPTASTKSSRSPDDVEEAGEW